MRTSLSSASESFRCDAAKCASTGNPACTLFVVIPPAGKAINRSFTMASIP